MGIFKELDFNDTETQNNIKRLIKQAVEVTVGEANDGVSMDDTYLNFSVQFALNKKVDSLSLDDLE